MTIFARDGLVDTLLTMLIVGVLCVPYLAICCPCMWLAAHAKGAAQ